MSAQHFHAGAAAQHGGLRTANQLVTTSKEDALAFLTGCMKQRAEAVMRRWNTDLLGNAAWRERDDLEEAVERLGDDRDPVNPFEGLGDGFDLTIAARLYSLRTHEGDACIHGDRTCYGDLIPN